MRGARSKKCTMDGITFDGVSECCFYCWCKEAEELGVIERFEMQQNFHLYDGSYYYVGDGSMKAKNRRTLLQGASYTSDFTIFRDVMSDDIRGLKAPTLWYDHAKSDGFMGAWNRWVIDVKGAHMAAGSAATFSLTQKAMWHINKIYVNKVVVGRADKVSEATKAKTFFRLNGLPSQLPPDCYLLDGSGLRQPWRSMFEGCKSISEVYNG